jgi:dihydrofolate synthase / folylpolyglutamate synthase
MSRVDPLEFLTGLELLGMKFGLENMRTLCAELDHPEARFRSIHVAGTNGKGSVTVMVETALRAAGHRAARYTSPHLVRLEERFNIGGADVETAALRESAATVRDAVERLVARGAFEAPPTFFECTTAVAFDLFRRARVEVAVLEVGLGGRLDATNVVTPVVSAITSIAFDHQTQLGDTLAAIAGEKAGIVKPGVPVVCGPLPADAARVVGDICAERGAEMVEAADAARVELDPAGSAADPIVNVRTRKRILERVPLALPGRHQIDNAAVAVSLLDVADGLGLIVGDDAVRAGLRDAVWPARLERFTSRDGSTVLLDAAHNPAGSRALASYVREIGWTGATLVFGAMRDKDVDGMLAAIAPVAGAIVVTTPPSRRALPAAELAAIVRRLAPHATVLVEADPAAALARACGLGRPVIAAGSIFLIGPLRDILR